ncbi:MAG: 1,2-phenylacetyl-CoA epoxidase subunit PaaE [Ferruginibacter sp.]
MAVHFHPLDIIEIKKETPDCVTLTFNVPPGLQEKFTFKEGQNITLKTSINGEEVRRSYSLCAAPHEGKLKVAVKKVSGGIFSSFANENLQVGDTIEVLPPTGNFFSREIINTSQRYLAIAAGSGITPVISIIKESLHTNLSASFTLLYGNKNSDSIIFFDELEDLKNRYMQRLQVIYVLSREHTEIPLQNGRIDAEKLASLKNILSFKNYHEIFLCGPEELIFTSRDFLLAEGIPASRIHFELFTIPGQAKSVVENKIENILTSDTGDHAQVTVKLDGRSFSFPLNYNGLNILDAALKQGADLPYACKGGVCCTCKARLTSGEIIMDVNYALEEEEVAAGYILTCQAHPRSPDVSIDFDIK